MIAGASPAPSSKFMWQFLYDYLVFTSEILAAFFTAALVAMLAYICVRIWFPDDGEGGGRRPDSDPGGEKPRPWNSGPDTHLEKQYKEWCDQVIGVPAPESEEVEAQLV